MLWQSSSDFVIKGELFSFISLSNLTLVLSIRKQKSDIISGKYDGLNII